jgi:hypothetical protein
MPGTVLVFLVVLFGGLFAMIFGIIYLKTRENLALLEKGINPKQQMIRPAPFKSLKLGLLLTGAGLGLLIAYLIQLNITEGNNFYRHNDSMPALYFSLIAIGGGLGLITSYAIERKYLVNKKEF